MYHLYHLGQLGFTYSACWPFTKNKKRNLQRLQRFKKTQDSRYIYLKEVDKACFQHDTADWDFKDLTRRILHDKAFNITKNDGYKREFCFNSFFVVFFLIKRLQMVLLKMKSYKIRN